MVSGISSAVADRALPHLFNDSAVSWAVGASPFIAGLALLVSLGSAFISYKSYALAKKKYEMSKHDVEIYYAEGFVRTTESGKYFAFLISITNKSEQSNSVKRINLKIDYSSQIGSLSAILLDPVATVGSDFPDIPTKPSTSPLKLEALQTVSGWFFFLAGSEVIQGARILGYEVVLEDNIGNHSRFSPQILSERKKQEGDQ